MITRINIKEQKLRANPIQFFISIIKWLKSLLRGKKKVWRNDKNQISCTPSKQSGFQFHLLVISSPCQSPFTPPLQSCSLLKTSSMVFTERNLSIKKIKNFNLNMSEISQPKLLLLWYYFNFYSTLYVLYFANPFLCC